MCLAIIALNVLEHWPLIVVANRDELHVRPTLAASPWSDAKHILGGRDLSAGGTWLGMTASGKLALLTNYREPGHHDPFAPSRGQLTEQYLRGDSVAQLYAQQLHVKSHAYNGFNLLLGDESGLWYCSNRAGVPLQRVPTGVVGLSNASLNTPWPKLKRTQGAVRDLLLASVSPTRLDPNLLFDIMADRRSASLDELPETGVGAEREKLLGSPFINNERYGTRSTTLLMQRSDGIVRFQEKCFDAHGQLSGESLWTIDTKNNEITPGTLKSFGF